MFRMFTRLTFVFVIASVACLTCYAQSDASSRGPTERRGDPGEFGKNIRETLAKQKAEREKKDFRELLDRSDQALRISEELEKSFETSGQVTSLDRERLQTLEKLVSKIRSELGGDDDDDFAQAEDDGPSDVAGAFVYLRDSAVKLAGQLKKSTRFTVSAAAIQTSNNFLRVIKFLRLRK
jgi:hypothetical protein